MRLLVHTIKLKSSPRQKLARSIFCDLANCSLTSSAFFCFKNKSVSSVCVTWSAKQDFEGWTATEIISLLQHKPKLVTYNEAAKFKVNGILVNYFESWHSSQIMKYPSLWKTSKLLKLSKKTSKLANLVDQGY